MNPRLLPLLALLAWAGAPTRSAELEGRIYLAPDDHTDYFWTADDVTYRAAFIETLDFYLTQIDATRDAPADFQARWNCDGSLWLWEYEHHQPAQDFARLMERIRDGHISSPLNALVSCYGGQPAEAVLRGMYYAGSLERRFGLRFPLVVAMENQTLPRGLGALWAGAGARWSWRGVCGCASKMPRDNLGRRDHEIYWWRGPDDSRVLMKWHSLHENDSIGGYAEARHPREAIDFVRTDEMFQARYPFSTIGIFGQGWDDLKTLSNEFPKVARERSLPAQPVAVSNEEDFFRDFEARHGAALPSEGLAYGNEWDVLSASMAEQSARVRRAVEKLRAAEAMATLVSLKKPDFWTSRKLGREQAHLDLGLYWEHDWTADAAEQMRVKRAAWQRRLADEIESYVEELHAEAARELGAQISSSPDSLRFFVFNPLGWNRSGVADFALPAAARGPLHAFSLAAACDIPSQIIERDGRRILRILARDVPPVGYTVFEVRPGAGEADASAARLTDDRFENDRLRVTFTSAGAITSLVEKSIGRELAGARALNTLSGAGVVDESSAVIESDGPVSTTLVIRASAPLRHTTRLTLRRDVDWLEIENVIEENFDDVRTWGFDFHLDDPETQHEEVGTIIRARLESDGGDYAVRNARYDWLSLSHFADLGSPDAGVTLANADCAFFKLGDSAADKLDASSSRLAVLAGGQVDGPKLGIPKQDGDTQFTQRFALRPRTGAFDASSAMRWSLEWQNPLVCGAVAGAPTKQEGYPATMFSLLEISLPEVLLWALKPAEEGIEDGVIARAWNLAPTPITAEIKMPGLRTARAVSHIETNGDPMIVANEAAAVKFAPQQLRTVRLKP